MQGTQHTCIGLLATYVIVSSAVVNLVCDVGNEFLTVLGNTAVGDITLTHLPGLLVCRLVLSLPGNINTSVSLLCMICLCLQDIPCLLCFFLFLNVHGTQLLSFYILCYHLCHLFSKTFIVNINPSCLIVDTILCKTPVLCHRYPM